MARIGRAVARRVENWLELDIETVDAVSGHGAVGGAPETVETAAAVLRRIEGLDPFDGHRIRAALKDDMSAGLLGAIETACFDLQAQQRQLSLAQMLGGAFRTEVKMGLRQTMMARAEPMATVPEFAEAVRKETIDIWIADPIMLGGPSMFARALALARTFSIDVAIDARAHGPIGEALALQLAASSRLVNAGVLVASGENGTRTLPEGAGLARAPIA